MDIQDIRQRLESGQFEFSRHALHRVVERNISEEEIREAGGTATIIEDYPDDKYSPSCLLLGFTARQRPLHMQICYTNVGMIKIVTIYEPDAAAWIENRIRRSP